jgi:uncharacterized membrane protein YdjX (TVP38/TMEM64 family)
VSPTRRLVLLVAGVAVLATTAWLLPLDRLPELVAPLGLAAPVVCVALGAALLVAMVPRTPISIACGLLFGPWVGTACALLVTVIAATVAFAAGRALGREFVARRAGRRWATLERWIARDGTLAVAAVRALPIGPYALCAYAYGASAVRIRHYALGTIIAGTPSAISYAYLGAAVARPGDFDPLTIIPLAFGLLLAAAVVTRAWWVSRRARRSGSGVAQDGVGELDRASEERGMVAR